MIAYQDMVSDVHRRFSVGEGVTNRQHERLLSLVKRLKLLGQESIDDRRGDMEIADDTYRAYRVPDAEDKKAAERGEPIKIIYPVTYAQTQTAIASLLSIFCKNPFYELESRGPAYYKNSKLMELELQYQLEHAQYVLRLYQWFLDTLKYGVGKINIGYQKQKSYKTRENTLVRMFPVLGYLGMPAEFVDTIIGFEGVELFNEDPYNTMFDPAFSVSNLQKSNFVFCYDMKSYNELKDDEQYFNVQEIPRSMSDVGDNQLQRGRARKVTTVHGQQVEGGDYIDLDICYVKLTPKDYELSESDKTEIWRLVMANDSRIIQAEPSRYEHGQFPCAVLEYNYDEHNIFCTNDGLSQVIDGLQDHLNWLLNSHMQSVRKTINNTALIDPDIMHIEDIENRRNYVRVKRGKGGLMDRGFKQLIMQDVTQGHVKDADNVLEMIQRTTGYSDNAMGVQLPTGRTATEVSAMQRLGSLRTRMTVMMMWTQGIEPLGRQMIANTQQFMEAERFMKVSGDLAMQLGVDLTKMPGDLIKVSPNDLQGMFKIRMTDVNTPSDKLAIANVLKETLMGVMQNPQIAMMMGLKPQAMLTRMFMLLGVPGITDLMGPVPPDQTAMMMQMMQGRAVQATVQPEEMVQKEQQKGNIIPFGGNGGGPNGGNGRRTAGVPAGV